jgi:hypothetical protein
VIIDSQGAYNGSFGLVNYFISGKGSIVIRGSKNQKGNRHKKIYTIFPDGNVVTITNFDEQNDRISLLHFHRIESLNDLTFKFPPLQLILSSQQQVILSSHNQFVLQEENFIFYRSPKQDTLPIRMDFAFIISLVIVFLCLCLFICCIIVAKLSSPDEMIDSKITAMYADGNDLETSRAHQEDHVQRDEAIDLEEQPLEAEEMPVSEENEDNLVILSLHDYEKEDTGDEEDEFGLSNDSDSDSDTGWNALLLGSDSEDDLSDDTDESDDTDSRLLIRTNGHCNVD